MDTDDDIVGNSCSFHDIENIEKPTIVGKIVDVLPLIKKSRTQSSTVLIFHCTDVSPTGHSIKKFKIIFFNEAAKRMWSLKLTINDLIAVREAVVFKDFTYSNTDLFYSKILVEKSFLHLTKYVLFKRNKEAWASIKNDLSEDINAPSDGNQNTNVKNRVERAEEIVSSSNGYGSVNENDTNDVDLGNISSTNWILAMKSNAISKNCAASNEPNHDESETSPLSQLNQNPGPSLVPKNNSQKTNSPFKAVAKKRSPESLMHGIVRCFEHKNKEKNISNAKPMSQLKCVYTKLGYVQENMVVNIIAIVLNNPEDPISTSSKGYCLIIRVSDDTKPDGIKIRMFFSNKKDSPILQKYYIILCHNVKFSRIHHELYGTIKDCRLIVTFDKDDLDVSYKQSADFNLTAEDKERVELLRNWMFENIQEARPFTPLASFEAKDERVNIRCQIADSKAFDKNIIVLRVSDGTTCQVPFHRIPFECDFWNTALAEMKIRRKPSREIDIIATIKFDYLFKKFKQALKVGSNVELYNVKLKLVPGLVKTKPEYSLKAFVEGTPENIVVIQKRGKISEASNSRESSPEIIIETVRKRSEIRDKGPLSKITNKRKLFEHSPRNEFVESDETDLEKSFVTAVSSKKSKSVTQSNDLQVRDPTALAASTTSSVEAHTASPEDVMSIGSFQTNQCGNGSEKQQSYEVSHADITFIAQKSLSTEVVQYLSSNKMDSELDIIPSQTVCKNEAFIREKTDSKEIRECLHRHYISTKIAECKALQERMSECEYVAKNEAKNYLHHWPSETENEAFYIQIIISSTLPSINGISSDFEVLRLISGYCDRCDHFFPFYLSKWIISEEDGPLSICPDCKEKGVINPLEQLMLCELLLSDEYGIPMPAVVMGHHAENFFGCTASQLISSAEAKIRVRLFLDSYVFTKGKEKKPLVVKLIRIYSPQSKTFKYHVLS